jgi:hypothetical protein
MNLLWGVAAILVAMWVVGFTVYKVASGLLHLLLVVAAAIVLFRFFAGRRRAS